MSQHVYSKHKTPWKVLRTFPIHPFCIMKTHSLAKPRSWIKNRTRTSGKHRDKHKWVLVMIKTALEFVILRNIRWAKIRQQCVFPWCWPAMNVVSFYSWKWANPTDPRLLANLSPSQRVPTGGNVFSKCSQAPLMVWWTLSSTRSPQRTRASVFGWVATRVKQQSIFLRPVYTLLEDPSVNRYWWSWLPH